MLLNCCRSLARAGSSEDGDRELRVRPAAPPPLNNHVYSLATLNKQGSGTTNMNIVTFATPVSIEPRRLWVVSLYKHTLSRENFEGVGGVLQVSDRMKC